MNKCKCEQMSRRGNSRNLANDSITTADIEKYIQQQSDFAFEMEILQIIKRKCSYASSWGGVYFDPQTRKQREYDIRTELRLNYNLEKVLKLAIECKNFKPNYPLVISCTPRIEQEQKIDVWHWGSNAQYERQFCCPTSFYQLNGWVGRSLDQVGKDSNSDLIIEDNSTYDKWTQALASLHGMLEDALSYNASDGYDYLVFLPLIVVPDGTLWQINYSAEGQRAGDPKQVDSVNFWIDVEYLIKHDSRSEYYNISHLHFLTKKGLINFLDNEPVLLNAFCRY